MEVLQMKANSGFNISYRNILLVILLGFLLTATSTARGESPAELFFDDSNVRVNYEEGNYILKLDTPIPVLCAVNFGLSGEEYGNLSAMNMTSPARDHDIRLELEDGREYRVVLTAFTRNHEVFRSKVYSVSTRDPVEGENLVTGTSKRARVLAPKSGEHGFSSAPEIAEIGTNRTKISFTGKMKVLASTALGKTKKFGRLVRLPKTRPFRTHSIDILGLEPGIKYFTETVLIDTRGDLYRSEIRTFTTLEEKETANYGENWARLEKGGSISGVSSNWGGDPSGTFGAKNAIDGDPGTEWSSQGEGNEAWIEIKLPGKIEISAIGFWTRTMGDTGQISKIRAITGTGKLLGEFQVPSADELHVYQVPHSTADIVRFEVLESSGGNTGAREIKVFGTPEG
jgi:hypothetical protein